ncbi:CinA family protein [Oceanimonas sp. MB9]|uniref:CinA family protein n=1 Tax=Oceanimonas sp. MB9 TaxID=2588453 RepID=UPI0013F66BE8|nr:CinA family protein [Oceanimonas sp. MB9]NHH99886.1 Nicotinamide-nucleotide amidohydrolase PncC [Oceanimonas sp. MB9]
MDTETLARQLGEALLARGIMMTTAESCTGGGIAAAVTDIAGSSAWFDRGFVTYSNAAKTTMLGVDAAMIERHGAVSREVAEAMVRGACAVSGCGLGVAVTGVAGPGGGSPDKPVGTVWLACYAAVGDRLDCRLLRLDGDRAAVRRQTVTEALQACLTLLEQNPT